MIHKLLMGFCILLLFGLAACGESGPTELIQAADVVEEMLEPINLSRSMYAAAFPDGKPSQFVSYMFSDMGVAEWPPSDEFADEIEREQMAASGMTMLPADVIFVPQNSDPRYVKQLVVTFDDGRSLVIVKGYIDPTAEPVLTRELKLPQVKPAVGIQEIYQANLEEGLSPQSFPAP